MPIDYASEDPDTRDRYDGNLDGMRDRVDAERNASRNGDQNDHSSGRSVAASIVDAVDTFFDTAFDTLAEALSDGNRREIAIGRSVFNAKTAVAKTLVDGRVTATDGLTVLSEVAPAPLQLSITATTDIARNLEDGYQPGDFTGPPARGVTATAVTIGAGALTGLATGNPAIGVAIGGGAGALTDAMIGDAIERRAADFERGVIDAARSVPGTLKAAHDTYNAGVQSMVDEAVRSKIGNFRPVVVDLDGDGFEIIGRTLSSVAFDMDGDGFREQVAWVAPHDGLLVMDLSASGGRTPDGQVTHYREFAFANITPENDTDLEAFARLYDSNRDGKFNAQDSAFSLARIWRDLDQDAIVVANEMRTLAAHGITEIGLRHSAGSYENRTDDRTIDGTTLFGKSYMVQHGVVRRDRVGDIELGTNPSGFRDVATSMGNLLELETAQRVRSFEMQYRGSANMNLHTLNLDSVLGDARANILDARGATENRVIVGMGGDDILYGGRGHDHLDGGAGRDRLFGGDGQDLIVFDATDREVRGGAGYDTGVFSNNVAVSVDLWVMQLEMLLSGDGSDRISTNSRSIQDHFVYAGGGNDIVSLAGGSDKVVGGGGNDTIRLGAGADEADGGEGDDRIFGEDWGDRLFGGAGRDFLDGGNGNDRIDGDDGNDTLIGGNHNDILLGGAGNDSLSGGSGSDYLRGDAGNDTLNGGDGSDRFAFTRGFGRDKITDFVAFEDVIVFAGYGSARPSPIATTSGERSFDGRYVSTPLEIRVENDVIDLTMKLDITQRTISPSYEAMIFI